MVWPAHASSASYSAHLSRSPPSSKRGQTSIPEYVITLSVFITLIILISILTRQPQPQSLLTADDLARILLQPGQPPTWNETTVILPGITSDTSRVRINLTKLILLDMLTQSQHESLTRVSRQPFSLTLFLPNGSTMIINTSPLPQQPTYQSIARRAVIINTSITTILFTTWKD